MSKRYIMTFEDEATALAAVQGNPEAYATGTFIWAEANATMWYVDTPGTIIKIATAV
jgi:Leu/Phe-tRNA-protein transferase